MHYSVSTLAALMLAAAQPIQAADDQVERAPVPGWVTPSQPMAVPDDASGLLFVRYQDLLIHLDTEGQSNFQGYRIKILHPNALQLGNISIVWNPAAGAPTVHAIRIYRDNAVIDVLETASFEVLRREGQLEAASLDGTLTAVLRVPDLRVGDELEVALTVRANDPTLGPTVAGSLFFNGEPAPGRYNFGLLWDAGQEPRIVLTPELSSVAQRGERAINLRFDNPAALSPPNDAPPRFGWQRRLEYSDWSSWGAVSARFAPLFRQAATLSATSTLRAEIRRIAALGPDPLTRARAALQLVQREVRYVYVGLDQGNLTPATADETWQRRYGDCKGKTALLLALLEGLGIDAEPVLANNNGGDDGLDARLPNPGMFNHVLVRARINGSAYWLDGTLPPVAEPALDPVIPYRWVLPVTAQASPLEQLPWRPAAHPDEITLFEIDARAGFAAPARITQTVIVRGIAGLAQQAQLSAVTPAQLLNGIRQQGIGSTWQAIDDARWRYDVRARASILTITGTGMVEWEDEADGSKYLTLPGGGFSAPTRRVRPAEQDQTAPYYVDPVYHCYVTTVRLPTDTATTRWSFNTAFDTRLLGHNYYRAFELRDGAIRMVRGSRTEQTEISADDAARQNARISSFDNSMARIVYGASRSRPASGPVISVPATYDIDWTADDVPCLAAATLAAATAATD